ncbi:hypothetical protein EON64_03855 [archaeon]|nr:MAG: hypothetical protein EON64_03855 [archaeon]
MLLAHCSLLIEKLGGKRKHPASALPPLPPTLPPTLPSIPPSLAFVSAAVDDGYAKENDNDDSGYYAAKMPRLHAPLQVDADPPSHLLPDPLTSPLSPSPPIIPVYRVPPPNPQSDKLEVFFLGTGCATPSKHRANSGILLKCVGGDMPTHRIPTAFPSFQPQLNLPSRPTAPPLTLPFSSIGPEQPTSAPKKRGGLSLDLSFLDQDNQPSGLYSNPSPQLNSIGERSLHTLSASPQLGTPLPFVSAQDNMGGTVNQVPDQYVLLDCGESVTSQLFYLAQGDVDRLDKIICNLKLIWISHHHADHATGIPCLLQQVFAARWRQRQKIKQAATTSSSEPSQSDTKEEIACSSNDDLVDSADQTNASASLSLVSPACSTVPFANNHTKQTPPSFWNKYMVRQNSARIGYEEGKILIVASESVLKYVDFVTSIAGLDDLVSLYPITQTLYAGCTSDVIAATNGVILKLQSIAVQHCQSSFGVVLETAHKQKYVYSGDCRPSQSLVKSGYRCDVLIHEATFADDRVADANKKKHSTFSEAIAIAKKMQAKCAVLTHFSQRYQLSYVSDSSQQDKQSPAFPVALAYDYLHFSYPSQAAVLPEATASIARVLQAIEANPLLAEDERNLDDNLTNDNGINENMLYEAPASSTSLNVVLPPWSRQSSDTASSDNYDG